jgi:REP-associated tyrosine transposase
MPRMRRKILPGRSYHITHRCYNREFRFQRAIERDNYRMRLFEMSRRYKVKVLDYMITSNHVHLLIWADTSSEISEAMRFLQGAAAQDYNRRKKRTGAYWSGRYNTTLIQDGNHLSRCLFYIGLNMVRAKAVPHPSKWQWCGFSEFMGLRKRYRIIDIDFLLNRLRRSPDIIRFREWYTCTIDDIINREGVRYESVWSEAMAVGSEKWLQEITAALPVRKRIIDTVQTFYDAEKEYTSMQIEELEISYSLKGTKKEQAYLTRS